MGASPPNQANDEISILEAKLAAMTIPEETQNIYKAEIKKLK
jgi:hypothetical protein